MCSSRTPVVILVNIYRMISVIDYHLLVSMNHRIWRFDSSMRKVMFIKIVVKKVLMCVAIRDM
jgi:hypothetical protein